MLIYSAWHNKSKRKSLESLTLLTTFTQFLGFSIKSNCPQGLKNSWEKSKIGTSLNLNLNQLWENLANSIKLTKETVLSMVQKLTLSYLILSEDNINAVLANSISNFR